MNRLTNLALLLAIVAAVVASFSYLGLDLAALGQADNLGHMADYAARFLVELHGRHESWSMAVARYHAGPDNDPAQKQYVCRVIANMVATGFGKWTDNARAFCGAR